MPISPEKGRLESHWLFEIKNCRRDERGDGPVPDANRAFFDISRADANGAFGYTRSPMKCRRAGKPSIIIAEIGEEREDKPRIGSDEPFKAKLDQFFA